MARVPTLYEELIVAQSLQELAELRPLRVNFEVMWEESAALIWPTMRHSFMYGQYQTPGEKRTEHQVDATGMLALTRFGAILDSLMTPRNMVWHQLEADDPYVMKDRATRLWFQNATRALFKHRYAPTAGFSGQNQLIYKGLGGFGTGHMFVDRLSTGPGLRYKAVPLGQTYFKENHQGIVNGFIRIFHLTSKQSIDMFGDDCPEKIREAAKANRMGRWEFMQRVTERQDYDPDRMDVKGKRYASFYISIDCKMLVSEGGYNTFPSAVTRYEQGPEEVYGRGPATFVLPALKTLNAEKKVFLKQGHRAADPVLLMADDGLVDMSMRPGAMNKGGWSAAGHPLVGVLPTGDIQITKEMMGEERALINDAFLVTLFQILTETPTMTATEVVERTNEKGILLAPTVGNQANEYLGPMIDRELDLLSQQGLLEEMPPALQEAQGAYSIRYTSPLAKAARAGEAAGFMRTLEATTAIVNVTQDPSPLDNFEFDVAIPEIADIQSVPESWIASPDSVKAKRERRAQAQQQAMQIQAMPAQAAMAKAETDRAVKLGNEG